LQLPFEVTWCDAGSVKGEGLFRVGCRGRERLMRGGFLGLFTIHNTHDPSRARMGSFGRQQMKLIVAGMAGPGGYLETFGGLKRSRVEEVYISDRRRSKSCGL